MDEKKITKAEFDEAAKKAVDKVVKRPELEGMAAFIVPMTGMMFASEMRDILFPDDETEVSEKC